MNNQNKDLFAKASESIGNAKAKTGYIFSNFLTYILIFALIFLQIVLTVFTFTYKGLKEGFLLATALNLSSGFIAFWLFMMQGKKNEAKANNSYNANCITWSSLSTKVQKKRPNEFIEYCERDTENKRKIILNSYLANALIDNKKWEELKDLNDEEFNEKVKEKNNKGFSYSKNQIAWLKKARKPIVVKRTDPCLILTGSSSQSDGEVGVPEKVSYETRMVIRRLITMAGYLILTSLIGLQIYEGLTRDTIAECIIKIFGIISSAVMGFYTGVTAIQIRNSMIKKNINFIRTFLGGAEDELGEEH